MSEGSKSTNSSGSWFGTVGVLIALLFKYKIFIGSFLLSFCMYVSVYGWPYAVTLIVLLYVHEMGHFVYMKAKGLQPQAPVFIPFLGAYVAMNNLPKDRATHAWSALAGPFVGGLAAVACYYYGLHIAQAYFVAAGFYGISLNLLQLVPVRPFDGGFIAQCMARWLLIPGSLLLSLVGFWINSWLLIILGILGLFQSIRSLKGGDDLGMTEATITQKALVSVSYVSLIGFLAYHWFMAYVVVQNLK